MTASPAAVEPLALPATGVPEAVAACYQCGKCSAGCPVAREGDDRPHVLVRLVGLGLEERARRAAHPWRCTGCAACAARCPNGVDVVALMDHLRSGGRPPGDAGPEVQLAARFHRLFLRSVERFGRAHELQVIRRLRGVRGVLADLPLGLRLLRRGALRVRAARVKDRVAVRSAFARARDRGEW